jgi:hypothetical protein
MKISSTTAWRNLGSTDPRQLVDARSQLHWAVQIVAAFADAELERLADDSQSNLGWRDDLGVLLGRQRPDGLAAGLRLEGLGLMVFDASGGVVSSLPLAGQTLDRALSSCDGVVANRSGGSPIRLRDYDMPHHQVTSGHPFTLEPEAAFVELSRWFANGNAALDALTTSQPGWSEVRCWPHHFDLGSVASLEPSGDPSRGRSIGIGMSPGDAWYPQPYFYVNPYGLNTEPAELPPLPSGGGWHTDGWLGAVLVGSALLEHTDPATGVAAFLDGAVAAARRLHET